MPTPRFSASLWRINISEAAPSEIDEELARRNSAQSLGRIPGNLQALRNGPHEGAEIDDRDVLHIGAEQHIVPGREGLSLRYGVL